MVVACCFGWARDRWLVTSSLRLWFGLLNWLRIRFRLTLHLIQVGSKDKKRLEFAQKHVKDRYVDTRVLFVVSDSILEVQWDAFEWKPSLIQPVGDAISDVIGEKVA